MKLLYGVLYKKYFPIKSASLFYEMDEKERETLTKWIKNIEKDISCQNVENKIQAMKHGTSFCSQVKLVYTKSINDLYLLLRNKQYSMLDEEDLDFVNDVLYRHKYNALISYFTFPIRKKCN